MRRGIGPASQHIKEVILPLERNWKEVMLTLRRQKNDLGR